MRVKVSFYSYLKDLTGHSELIETVQQGAKISDLLTHLQTRFPRLISMENSILIAVGVDYAPRDYSLNEGDHVSLFPPVQGG